MNRLEAMDAFVRVVDTGSFSVTARQLGVSQPTVSKVIAQLEQRLGVRLLRRSSQALSLTEAGESFYAHARRAIEEADAADLAARGAGAALSGRLRICAAVTFARLHVIPRLGEFLKAHPSLDLELMLDDRHVDLIEAGGDVALRMGSLTDSTLSARRIGQAPRRVVATPSYLRSMGEPQTPADLLGHQVIVYDVRGGGATWAFAQGTAETSITLRSRLRVSAAEGVREAVFNDLGLAVASEWLFAPELADGRVRAVLRDWTLPPIDLWAVFPTGRQASAKARAFVAFMHEHLTRDQTAEPIRSAPAA